MKGVTLEEIASFCRGSLVCGEAERGIPVTGATADSRDVAPGFLFIAIRGGA